MSSQRDRHHLDDTSSTSSSDYSAENLPTSYQNQKTYNKKNKKRKQRKQVGRKGGRKMDRENEDDGENQHELTQIRHDGGYGQVKQALAEGKKPISIDDAVESLGMGMFQFRILFAAGLCFAADSMEVLLLSFLSVVLKAVWDLTDEQTSIITSSVFVGALIGTLVLGYLGDLIGRKPVFTLTAGIICLSGFLTAVANNYWTLLFFRFLVGFGVGGLTVPFDTLAEFVPNSQRGSNLLLIEYFWTAGTLLVPVLAFFSFGDKEGEAEDDWRIFVVLCGVPCFLSCVASILYVPESPHWLLTQGKHEEALFVLRRAARENGKDPDELFPMDTVIINEEEESNNFMDLFKPEWRKTTILLWITWAGFAFAYYGTIIAVTLAFSVEDDTEQGGEGVFDFDYGAIFASASAEVAGTTVVLLTVDRLGRIPSQVVSYLGGGIAVFAMCMGANAPDTVSREFLICMGFLARMFFMAATCTTWVSTAEILATEVRATGHASANAIARMFGAFSPFVVSQSTPWPVIGSVLLGFGVLNAYTSFNLPETKGRGMGMQASVTPKQEETVEAEPPQPTTYGIV